MATDRIEDTLLKETAKKKDYSIAMGSVLIILLLITILAGRACFTAEETGKAWGTTAGKLAGKAVGSYRALTEGIAAGAEAGKQQGLSAEDTEVQIGNSIQRIGKLEVLLAESQICNDMEIGNDYTALFVYKTKIIFSVDLESAKVTISDNEIQVIVPQVEVEMDINENESEKLVEWQKYFWSGSRDDGYIAYMNSMAKIAEQSVHEIENYDTLTKQAEESARRQIESIVKLVRVSGKEIKVVFENDRS